jgi:hypothetical protein
MAKKHATTPIKAEIEDDNGNSRYRFAQCEAFF